MRESVAFDRPDQGASDGLGGTLTDWTEIRMCQAEFIYVRGSEAVEAARLQGRAVFKVRMWNTPAAREIRPKFRMRTVLRGLPDGQGADDAPGMRYNIIEVDAITNRRWIYLVVESEVV